MKHLPRIAVAAACIVLSTASFASSETRHMGKHVHGEGQLNFAVEGSQVYLELDTPGFNILGFESITTDTQRHQLQDAYKKLSTGELWGLTPAASCKLAQLEIPNKDKHHSEDADHDDHHDDHHDEHAQKHDDHHDDHHDKHADEHGDHADHADHHDDHGEGNHHMDIEVTYVYQCGDIDKLNSLSTANFFTTFPNSRKLNLQGLTAKGQVFGQLTPEHPEERF